MKFGFNIGQQQEGHSDVHYLAYGDLKKKIKDVVTQLEVSDLGQALTANKAFEDVLGEEIKQVNEVFEAQIATFIAEIAQLSEELQQCPPSERAPEPQEGAPEVCKQLRLGHMFVRLAEVLENADALRKYAVWNAVAVVKILKKRRKQTNLGLEDSSAERGAWLSRHSFFSGTEFAELHAAIESYGQALVMAELAPLQPGSSVSTVAASGSSSASKALEELCPICMDPIRDVVELDCEHRFCWKCFVLGPIAHQPGEYKINQCPMCRKETSSRPAGVEQAAEAQFDESASAEDLLNAELAPSRPGAALSCFLHTYFPQAAKSMASALDEDGDKGDDDEEEKTSMTDIVSGLVKVVLNDAAWQRSRAGGSPGDAPEAAAAAASSSASSSSAMPASSSTWPGKKPGDFFDTLPAPKDKSQLEVSQKLQWLQLASNEDPYAFDDMTFCEICNEPLLMETVTQLPCKHAFHSVCLRRLELPRCTLCGSDVAFSHFLPHGHRLAECGFRVVLTQHYKPMFPGGPGRGNGGFPLHCPPPDHLFSGDRLMMKSYLHKMPPMGTLDCESDTERSASSSKNFHSRKTEDAASVGSDDSSSESGSDDDIDDRDFAGGKGKQWLWCSSGKMRQVELRPEAQGRSLAELASHVRSVGQDGHPVQLRLHEHLAA